MIRLKNADELMRSIPPEEIIARCIVANAPTVGAIPIEWVKKHIENDRQSAEKAKAEKNDKLFHYYKTSEICAECLLFDWEDENGKYKEFEGEIWQD